MTTRRLAKQQNKLEEMTLKPSLGFKAFPTTQVMEINVQIPGLVNSFGAKPASNL